MALFLSFSELFTFVIMFFKRFNYLPQDTEMRLYGGQTFKKSEDDLGIVSSETRNDYKGNCRANLFKNGELQIKRIHVSSPKSSIIRKTKVHPAGSNSTPVACPFCQPSGN